MGKKVVTITTADFGIKLVTSMPYNGHEVRLASTNEIPEIENTFIVCRDIIKALNYSYKTNIPNWCSANCYTSSEVLLLEDTGIGNKNIFWVSLKKLKENVKPLVNTKLVKFLDSDVFKDPIKLVNLFLKTEEGETTVENNENPLEQMQDELIKNLQKQLAKEKERNAELVQKSNDLYEENVELKEHIKYLNSYPTQGVVMETNPVEPVLTLQSLVDFLKTQGVSLSISPA